MKEHNLRFKLNNAFYSKHAIKQSINDFQDFCQINIIDDSFMIEIEHVKGRANLKEEFCNYVLSIQRCQMIEED